MAPHDEVEGTRMKRTWQGVGLALAVFGLVACGRMPQGLSSAKPSSPFAAKAREDASALRAGLAKLYEAAPGLRAVVETLDVGPTGNQNPVTLKVASLKPLPIFIEVTKGNGEGTRLRWEGGDSLKAKPKFPPIAVTLKLTDERLITFNHWTLKDTAVAALFDVALDPGAKLERIADVSVDGVACAELKIQSAKSPKGASYEHLALELATFRPRRREIYGAKANGEVGLMYRLTMKQLELVKPAPKELEL